MSLIKDLLNLNTWSSVLWVFLIALNSLSAYGAETASDGIVSGFGLGMAVFVFFYLQVLKRANEELYKKQREVIAFQHGRLIKIADKVRELQK